MRQELGGLNSSDRVLHQANEFLPLLVGNGSSQAFADEHDLADFGNAGHPGVASQLRIQR